VAALQGVVRAPLLFGLDDGLVRPLAETFAVLGGAPVGHDLAVQRDLAVGKGFQRAFVVILGVGKNAPCRRLRQPLEPAPCGVSRLAERAWLARVLGIPVN
jgi:hypothetical protein